MALKKFPALFKCVPIGMRRRGLFRGGLRPISRVPMTHNFWGAGVNKLTGDDKGRTEDRSRTLYWVAKWFLIGVVKYLIGRPMHAVSRER